MATRQLVGPELSSEIRKEVRKQAISIVATWSLYGVVLIIICGLVGWIAYIDPLIKRYVEERSIAVPSGAVLASVTECAQLVGKWETFTEGTGRFLVGAGTDHHSGYVKWTSEGGVAVKLRQYNILDLGGEEKHLIKIAEAPEIIGHPRNDYGGSHDTGATQWVETKQQATPINILPPYVAVFYCKKK